MAQVKCGAGILMDIKNVIDRVPDNGKYYKCSFFIKKEKGKCSVGLFQIEGVYEKS